MALLLFLPHPPHQGPSRNLFPVRSMENPLGLIENDVISGDGFMSLRPLAQVEGDGRRR